MAKVSAQQVYALHSGNSLTKEQIAIVEEASLEAPSLVIAGAGSGKTELMMVRVMYLVANGFAKPEEILGLTFTRKAANELRSRIASGLIRLRESGLWQRELGDDFSPAKIVTYNSFGNEIFRAHALSLGFELDSQLLTESLAIASVKELIETSGNPKLEDYDGSLNDLAEKVLKASAQLIDHQADAEEVCQYFDDFVEQLSNLPKTEKGDSGRFSYTDGHLEKAKNARLIFELARDFQDYKKERNLFDYADQVALSLQVQEFDASVLPYRFVMLDEYQDTSEIQVRLLSRLFANKPVMAVGDPNQSIYAWRGASTSNLADFFEDFGQGESYTLSTSWRSGEKILSAANQIAASIDNGSLTPIQLSAGLEISSRVLGQSFASDLDECESVSRWISEKITPDSTAAILFRNKDSIPAYSLKLTELGVAHEITGLSGLLEQPEVIDLISILRLVARPDSSVDFLRAVTGPRFRIAPSDIAVLTKAKRQISWLRRLPRNRQLTLMELVDQLELPSVRKELALGEASLLRLREFAQLMRALRSSQGLSLTELAWKVVEDFEIDIELFVHSQLQNPLSYLRSFISRISDFESSSQRPSLSALIDWLDFALESENFELPRTGAKKGMVQLMSVHAAKGLEWDYVAVPTLSEGSFPSDARDLKNWLAGGILPGRFRLDKKWIPNLDWHGITNQREFEKRVETYGAQLKAHNRIQERRLAYVAFTRAAKELYLTTSHFYRKWKSAVDHSEFFLDLLPGHLELLAEANKPEGKPQVMAESLLWPRDPLGAKRAQVEKAKLDFDSAEPAELTDDIKLLIREQKRNEAVRPTLPLRLSASSVVRLLTGPEEFASALARPLPAVYSATAAVGTSFHANLEETFLAGSELDFANWSEDEKELGVNFSASRFATLKPHSVEQSIEFPLAGSVIVCKLDAVYEENGEYQIVDWKSGRVPNEAEIPGKAIQLALYRIALSRKLSIPVERIKASFFYAADGTELEPDLPSEMEIAGRLAQLRKAHPNH